jgi:mRNA-degrading endonuclease YafQ of YafQ-DinJ toxin-antitoxin module
LRFWPSLSLHRDHTLSGHLADISEHDWASDALLVALQLDWTGSPSDFYLEPNAVCQEPA